MAKVALLYSSVFGNEAYESLLSFMRTEKNDTLDEVTDDFVEISNKLVPPIELFCAWEQVPTQVSYGERAAQKIPRLLQHKFFKAGARKAMEVGCSAMLGNGTVSTCPKLPSWKSVVAHPTDKRNSISSKRNQRHCKELTALA